MNNLYNNQLKYLSFHKKINNVPMACQGIAFSSFLFSSMASHIISKPSLLKNKNTLNLTKHKYGLINMYTHFSTNNLTEGNWRALWSRKFKQTLCLGFYTPDLWDKLLFVFLNEQKEKIQSKYTFNNFLSGSQLISYNFNKNIKKVDLNSLYNYLNSFFKTLSSLISFPVLEIYPDKVKIRLFYYVIPSKKKQHIHKILHKYIRNDEKLYKEIILRRNFKRKMEQFKMKLFIAKWKEDHHFIRIPQPISYFKGFTLGLVNFPFKEGDQLEKERYSYDSLEDPNKNISANYPRLGIQHPQKGVGYTLNTPNYKFNRSNEYNISLDLLKLDFSKFSQQDDKLESLLRDLHNIKQEKNSIMTNKPGKFIETNFNIHRSKAEELQYQTMSPVINSTTPHQILVGGSVISNSYYLKEPMLEESLSSPLKIRSTLLAGSPVKSLKTLKDRQVSTIVSLNKVKFKYFIFTLEKLFKKTIILDLVRLKYPYHESNILAQILSLSCKTKDFRQIMRKLLYTATISNPSKMIRKQNITIIPSYLSGIKVRLGGRLITQRVVPRFTVQSLQIGSLARGKVNFTDSSRITLKNKRGAFSFTVTTSHIF